MHRNELRCRGEIKESIANVMTLHSDSLSSVVSSKRLSSGKEIRIF